MPKSARHPLEKKPSGRHHHGNLKHALVEAGLELLREQGLEAMSLRAVARSLGVSQTAPYSHFADKRMLLAGVSAHGFRLFSQHMRKAVPATLEPAAIVSAMAHGYVAFAHKEPQLFRLMFGSWGSLDGVESAELRAATEESFALLSAGSMAALPRSSSRAQVMSAALALWSLVHGLSHLLLDRMIVPEMLGLSDRKVLSRTDREAVIDAVTRHFSLAVQTASA